MGWNERIIDGNVIHVPKEAWTKSMDSDSSVLLTLGLIFFIGITLGWCENGNY